MSEQPVAETQDKGMQTAVAASTDAMTLVSQAVANGAQVDQVDKLIELVKFNDEREALRAFNQAFTDAQSEFPEIPKTKEAHNSKFAPLDQEVRLLRPVLMKHGFSFRHEVTENDGKSVSVRCILAHQDGHCESATLTGPADNSGSKNTIQAIGSTVTYLRRYTFEAVTGIVTTDDDDGKDAGDSVERVSKDQSLDIHAKLEETGADKNLFLRAFGKRFSCSDVARIEDIPTTLYDNAIQMIEANDKRKQGEK